jgi:hypothetical protein
MSKIKDRKKSSTKVAMEKPLMFSIVETFKFWVGFSESLACGVYIANGSEGKIIYPSKSVSTAPFSTA